MGFIAVIKGKEAEMRRRDIEETKGSLRKNLFPTAHPPWKN